MEWWFGEGLSYTEFEYTDLEVKPDSITEGDTFTVRKKNGSTVLVCSRRQGGAGPGVRGERTCFVSVSQVFLFGLLSLFVFVVSLLRRGDESFIFPIFLLLPIIYFFKRIILLFRYFVGEGGVFFPLLFQ